MQKLLFLILFLDHFATAQTPVWQDISTKKLGIYNTFTNEPIWPARFDYANPIYLHDSLLLVKKNGRSGVVSTSGRTVVPLDFDEIQDVKSGEEHGILAVLKNGNRGLWSVKTGRQILPIEFEFARAIFPDLIATRRKDSHILEFLDKNAQKMFETAGETASPGFDETCIEITGTAGEYTFLDKKGKAVFSENFKNGRWTDGKTIVVQMSKPGISDEKYALVTTAGDTILAASNYTFQPLGEGRFFVKSTSGRREMGFFDANLRQWLVPMDRLLCFKLGEKGDMKGAVFVQKMDGTENHFLCDAAGKLLFENCKFTNFPYDAALAQAGDDYHPFRYFQLYFVGKSNEKGLFDADGQVILPMEFEAFSYRTERHAIIAFRKINDLANAFDPKTGKKLFAEDFQNLKFTADPTRFWAKKGGKWGIIETAHPESVVFDFDQYEPFQNFWVFLSKNEKWYVFDGKGNRAIDRDFDWFMGPTREKFQEFKDSKTAKGKLFAVGGDRTKPNGWFGINDRNQHFFIENKAAAAASPMMNDVEERAVEKEPPPPMLENVPEPPPAEPFISKNDHVYLASDRRPEFPGGESVMLKFLSKNMQYPSEARKNGIQGRVGVTFIIEKDGSLSDVKINMELGSGCDEEAIRLVKSMPKWKPGHQVNGEIVRVSYSMWVSFKLN